MRSFRNCFERLAADLADQIADHVGGDRVIPGLARREFQRDLGQVLDHRLQRARLCDLADLLLAIGGIDIGALLEAVGQARGVAQQVDDQHRPRRRPGQECRRRAGLEHAEVFPFRDVFVDGLVERDAAFLEQHHEGHAGDRLGHRIDAEDGVVLDRHLALDVGKALHRRVDHLAAAIDQELRPRKAAGIDVAVLEMRIDAVEALLGHAGGFGRGGGRGEHRVFSGRSGASLDSRKVPPVPITTRLPLPGRRCRLAPAMA